MAERVAAERGEKCGESIGYAIRGETRISRDKNRANSTRLLFCTTGEYILIVYIYTTGES